MEPTNDHERLIAQSVDEKFLSLIRDIAISLDFVMSP